MSLYVLDVVCWIFGIRGHIPHHDDFRAGGGAPPFAATGLTRILAAAVISVAVLALLLWAAVWLAIKLL
jgi:hypothetical protein